MPVKKDEIFYDPHCHAMTIAHPNILMFLQEFRKNFADEVISELFSPGYLLDPRTSHPVKKAGNMLAVMEHDIAGIFKLMEDDLAGRFLSPVDNPSATPEHGQEHGQGYDGDHGRRREEAAAEPELSLVRNRPRGILRDGVLHFRGREYRQLVLTPLVMDFSGRKSELEGLYYNRAPERPIWNYARDVLKGIQIYHRDRPRGMLRIYPFLGINTASYSLRELEELLKKYFSVYSSSFAFRTETTRLINAFSGIMDSAGSNLFSGIKVYPPLGFDPWPEEEPEELEKVKLLYRFCRKRRIPITTHCDDQGYRTLPIKRAWRNSSPKRWALALEAFPDLKVNFGHYGYQYVRKFRVIRKTEWLQDIFTLMDRFEHVYADFSFNGTNPDYYPFLKEALDKLPRSVREEASKRTLFGTDFMLNLTKTESYLSYYRQFEASPFSDELVHRFVCENPRSFLFTEDGTLDRVRSFFEGS